MFHPSLVASSLLLFASAGLKAEAPACLDESHRFNLALSQSAAADPATLQDALDLHRTGMELCRAGQPIEGKDRIEAAITGLAPPSAPPMPAPPSGSSGQ